MNNIFERMEWRVCVRYFTDSRTGETESAQYSRPQIELTPTSGHKGMQDALVAVRIGGRVFAPVTDPEELRILEAEWNTQKPSA